jgi:hypothetical protein
MTSSSSSSKRGSELSAIVGDGMGPSAGLDGKRGSGSGAVGGAAGAATGGATATGAAAGTASAEGGGSAASSHGLNMPACTISAGGTEVAWRPSRSSLLGGGETIDVGVRSSSCAERVSSGAKCGSAVCIVGDEGGWLCGGEGRDAWGAGGAAGYEGNGGMGATGSLSRRSTSTDEDDDGGGIGAGRGAGARADAGAGAGPNGSDVKSGGGASDPGTNVGAVWGLYFEGAGGACGACGVGGVGGGNAGAGDPSGANSAAGGGGIGGGAEG